MMSGMDEGHPRIPVDFVPRKIILEEPKAVAALREFRDLMNSELCSGAAMNTYGSCVRMLLEHWKANPPTTEHKWVMFDNFRPKVGRPKKNIGAWSRSRTS